MGDLVTLIFREGGDLNLCLQTLCLEVPTAVPLLCFSWRQQEPLFREISSSGILCIPHFYFYTGKVKTTHSRV